MRVIGLKAENIKRLKAIDLTPNKFINRISGANGSGKTSILDGIEWALTGTSTVPSQPVRKGSGRAVIQLDLGDIVVTRRFTEGGSRNGTLALEAKDSKSRYQGPQEILDKLMGKISFDPLEFLRMHPKKQFEVLRSLVKVDVDLDALDAEYKADYLTRRDLKKERDAVEIRRDAIAVAADLPKAKINEVALVTELQEVSGYNEGIAKEQRHRDERKGHRDVLERDINENKTRIEELRAQLAEMEEETAQWIESLKRADAMIKEWKPLPEPKDAAALAEQITKARATNAAIDRRDRRDSYQQEIDELDSRIETLSAGLKAKEEAKVNAISSAEFPVPGLAFGDEEVIYEGLPFNQVSNADQIRASVAIGMATNPELRVMRIKDGSLLDDASMNIVSQMAHEHDFQVFVEVVDTSGKVGVYLEDGEVKAVNPEPEPKATKAKRAPSKKKIPATA